MKNAPENKDVLLMFEFDLCALALYESERALCVGKYRGAWQGRLVARPGNSSSTHALGRGGWWLGQEIVVVHTRLAGAAGG